ncbi:hypothetical protein C8J56DRAFT_1059978 [Mycena floridula]|nr:hypothetical protein C8J56DRAFT_1059978 [Mycena floridula]
MTSKSSLEHLQPSFKYLPSQTCNSNSLLSLLLLLPLQPPPRLSATSSPLLRAPSAAAVENPSSPGAVLILKSLGIDVSSITGLVGIGCSPITVVGAGNGACSTTTVTCQDNSHSAISLGCVPVTL